MSARWKIRYADPLDIIEGNRRVVIRQAWYHPGMRKFLNEKMEYVIISPPQGDSYGQLDFVRNILLMVEPQMALIKTTDADWSAPQNIRDSVSEWEKTVAFQKHLCLACGASLQGIDVMVSVCQGCSA